MKKAAQKVQKKRRILGIDPGTNVLGWGIIDCQGQQLKLVEMDVINMKKMNDHFSKLKHIFEECCRIIKKYNPEEMSIEAPFHGKNVQSMLKLGRAQGVALAAGLTNGLDTYEYAPKRIKQSITGNGNSSKEQLAKMLQNTLQLKELPKYFDSTDAVAAAVCHFYKNEKLDGAAKSYTGWSAFLEQNKGRIK